MGARMVGLRRFLRREGKGIAIVAAAVLATALLLAPSIQSTMADGDGFLGFVEFVVYPLTLAAALVLRLVGRRATVIAGAALLAAAGLTICQPFGVVVRGHVPPAEVDAGTLMRAGEDAAYWSWFPPLRVAAYRRDTTSLSDGSGGFGDAMARTWL